MQNRKENVYNKNVILRVFGKRDKEEEELFGTIVLGMKYRSPHV